MLKVFHQSTGIYRCSKFVVERCSSATHQILYMHLMPLSTHHTISMYVDDYNEEIPFEAF